MRSTTILRVAIPSLLLLFPLLPQSTSAATDNTYDETQELPSLFPFCFKDYVGFSVAILGLVLAAGGGVGGGGILVPTYILLLDFQVKHAIPLASVTVWGGAVANNLLNARESHPEHPHRPVIDWDLVLLLEPMTILGAMVGTTIYDFIPDLLLVVLMILLLVTTACKTLAKANKMYDAESKEILRRLCCAPCGDLCGVGSSDNLSQAIADDDVYTVTNDIFDNEPPTSNHDDNKSMPDVGVVGVEQTPITTSTYDNYKSMPEEADLSMDTMDTQTSFDKHDTWQAIKDAVKLTALFIAVTILKLFAGAPESEDGGDSSFGHESCGVACFWATEVGIVVLIVAFAGHTRWTVLNRYPGEGHRLSDIEWDEHNTLVYPLYAMVAGLAAGMFGVGGGIIKGPLMLALGVHPAVAAASSACMILYTSSTSTLSYIMFGSLVYNYGALCFLIGLLATLLGQTLMKRLLRESGRDSFIAFSIGGVVMLSAIAMGIDGIVDLLR